MVNKMKRIYKCLSLFSACLLGAVSVSCVKEIFGDGAGELDGVSSVSFELQGLPLQSALTRTAGDAVRHIDNLYILFYTKGQTGSEADYELACAFTNDPDCRNDVFSKELEMNTEMQGRTSGDKFNPNDNEWTGVAESETQNVKTSEVQVKRGSYAVYVVANVPQFSSADFSKEEIATAGKLRNYQLTWNAGDVAANDAMFGFFTKADDQKYDVINEAAPLIKITSEAVTLHAWVKRAVSKVTVAFDGSGLRDGVRVYVKNVRIHDIPANCKLGADNVPDELQELIADGEQIIYAEGSGATVATRISNREPYFPEFSGMAEDYDDVAEWKKNVHSETRNSLYFFENLQGLSSGDADADGSWKQQTDTDGNGIPDDRDNSIDKDTKAYGTYVEVEAYYQNDNFGAKTEGDIKYRFMLGKNATNDFNAERNNHYKLTLCFKNNANDVDWHIDYTDKEDIYIPDIIYVSYDYNSPSLLPIRIVGDRFTSLNVSVTESNWYPDDSTIDYFKAAAADPSGPATGFLSLRCDKNPRIGGTNDPGSSAITDYWNTPSTNHTRQYIDNGYKVECPDLDDYGYGVAIRTNSDGKTVFEANIPLFTRPLIIYKWTSWTGANPYYSSSRSAKIILTGTIGGRAYEKEIKVIQVPRIENPSGIYRRNDSDESFDVICMARAGEMYNSNISFSEFKSVGAWRAVIYRMSDGNGAKSDWFTLTAGAQKADAIDEYIQGDANTPIKFKYKPNGTIGQNEVRCGIIKVEYNDYTCTHYIFVRQGYAPMQLETGRVYWHTFNLYSGNEETRHPCDAGSLFVRGNWAPAILDTNPQVFGQSVTNFNVIDANGSSTTMARTAVNNSVRGDFTSGSRSLTVNELNPWNSGRMPSIAEWATLKDENSNEQIDKGFGVLYGDGVSATQTVTDDVFGCLHANVAADDGRALKGMRGCFVYNTSDGRNIFLPIGASGYGRRKVQSSGQLQYGFGNTYSTTRINQNRRPLLYNLYSNEGAIYWSYNQTNVSGLTVPTNSWDINYKTFDFDYMDAEQNSSAACYIRLVQSNPPQ